jgi:hypothetical protein
MPPSCCTAEQACGGSYPCYHWEEECECIDWCDADTDAPDDPAPDLDDATDPPADPDPDDPDTEDAEDEG